MPKTTLRPIEGSCCILLAMALPAQTPPQRFFAWTEPTFAATEYQARRGKLLTALQATGGVLGAAGDRGSARTEENYPDPEKPPPVTPVTPPRESGSPPFSFLCAT